MYKILIDATERYNKSVKLVETLDNKVLFEKVGDFDIVSVIQDALTLNNLKPSDILEFVPLSKPDASFTGLKISYTVANVLNWSLGKKSIPDLLLPDYGREPNITIKPTA